MKGIEKVVIEVERLEDKRNIKIVEGYSCINRREYKIKMKEEMAEG